VTRALALGAAFALCMIGASGVWAVTLSAQSPASTPPPPLAATVHPPVPRVAGGLWLAPTVTDQRRTRDRALTALKAGLEAARVGRHVEAVNVFTAAAAGAHPLAAYATYYAALSELELNDLAEARRLLGTIRQTRGAAGASAAAGGAHQGYLVEASALAEATVAERQGDYASAVGIYRELTAQKVAAPDEVWMRMGRAALAGGNRDRAIGIFARVYSEFPLSAQAAAARTELGRLRALEPLSPGSAQYQLELVRAQRLFAAGRYADAAAAFTALRPHANAGDGGLIALRLAETDVHRRRFQAGLASLESLIEAGLLGETEDEALHYQALAQRGLGTVRGSIRTVRRLADRFPASPSTEEALNELATYHIRQDQLDEADQVLRELFAKFPAGRYAERAGWKVGWRAYRARRYAEAIPYFELTARRYARSDYRPSLLYWAGRAHEALGRFDLAVDRYTLTTADYLNTYYGRLAAGRLATSGRSVAPPTLRIATTGSDAPPNAEVIRLLLALDLHDDALAEVQYAQRTWGNGSLLQGTEAWIANRRGDLLSSVATIKRAYPQYMTSGGGGLPPELHELMFPLDFWDEIRAQAVRHKLDQYVLAALIAQESGFNPTIESSARAVGLMQLLPATARQYAVRLGLGAYHRSMLTTPATNLRMGSALLGDLVRRFADLHLALAAYNAGGARVARWIAERAGDRLDRDEFIDDMPFPETQTYVKKILSMSQDYRRLYGGLDGAGADGPGPSAARATR
jgi:soluble lytic murein transglycosylase